MTQVWNKNVNGRVVDPIEANRVFMKPRLCGCGMKHMTVPSGSLFYDERYWFQCECGSTLSVMGGVLIEGDFTRSWIESNLEQAMKQVFVYSLYTKTQVTSEWTLDFKTEADRDRL